MADFIPVAFKATEEFSDWMCRQYGDPDVSRSEFMELRIFEKAEFGSVRVVMKGGEPWFVAKDVCNVLELENVGQALTCLDDDEKTSIAPNIITADVGFDAMMQKAHLPMHAVIPEAGRGGRPLSLISEPGLYSLILRSRKPEAKAFKRWITHEVIPSIRKTGAYATNNALTMPNFSNPAEAAGKSKAPSFWRTRGLTKETPVP